MTKVRRLSAGDWQLLKAIRLEMLADTPMAYVESLEAAERQTDTQWQARAESMTGPDSVTLIAETAERQEAVGLMRVVLRHPQKPEPPVQAVLTAVYIAPKMRGLGVADELLHAALFAAVELGAGTLELAVHEDNARARSFYHRHGFSLTGESHPYPQDHSRRELVMVRPLD